MTTNPAFNFYNNTLEQTLYEDLIIESIQMYGYDVSYIPRRLNDVNPVLNEDTSSYYDKFYNLEMYIKSFDGYTGDTTFLSKFNIEVRNEIVFSVSKRRYGIEIGTPESSVRPREGDLIWYAMDKKLFMIKKVEQYNVFYQLGALQTWDLYCEPFEYAGEHFSTGIAEVDAIETNLSLNTSSGALMIDPTTPLVDELGYPILLESINLDTQSLDIFADNIEIEDSSDQIVDFSEDNPFSENF